MSTDVKDDANNFEHGGSTGMTGEAWVLAIDFGTSFTVAAARAGDRPPEVIEIDGERRLPSVMFVEDGGAVMIGRDAEHLAAANPGRVLRAPKSRLGEPAPVVLGGRPFPITSLVADLLAHVYGEAVRYQGTDPVEVRLTHPATWSGPRRQQLLAAAETAGLPEPVLVPEPVAAAIAYVDDGEIPIGGHVVVYDLGGGTFDTAVLQASPDGFVVAGRPAGDPRLGGELFDELVANLLGEQLDADVLEQMQLAEDELWAQAAGGLLREARRAKEALSSHPYADVVVALPTGMVQLRIARDDLDQVIAPYIDETVEVMRQTVIGAGLDDADLSSIYLVGGASRSPLVGERVAAAFPDVALSRRGDPKGVVALGATNPLATPTSLAQRSSLDRASTVERPGPPPPAAPVVAGATVVESGSTSADGTVIDNGTVVDDGTVIDGAAGNGTMIDGADVDATAPDDTKRPVGVLVTAGVLVVALIVAIALVATRQDDDSPIAGSATTTTAQSAAVAGNVGVPTATSVPTPVPPTTVPEPVTTPPATSAVTVPATSPPTTSPPTTSPPTTSPPTTAPPATDAPVIATAEQLRTALVSVGDFAAGSWTEVPYSIGDPFCEGESGIEPIVEVASSYNQNGDGFHNISHSVMAYADVASAAEQLAFTIDWFENCTATTYDLLGVTYDMAIFVEAIPDDVPSGTCLDDGTLVGVTLTNPSAAVPLILQFSLATICGNNGSVVTFATDQLVDDAPPEYYAAVGSTLIRMQSLPGAELSTG